MGGPGEDAIGAAELIANQFAPLRQDRDIPLVDQRGAGPRQAKKITTTLSTGVPIPRTPADKVRLFRSLFRGRCRSDAQPPSTVRMQTLTCRP
jgi:hypothetical protein